MTAIMVDIESDGPIPGDYSMICFGAVVVDDTLDTTFYGQCRPISDQYVPAALAVSCFSPEQTLQFPDPAPSMASFDSWIRTQARSMPMFIADNNGFDWQFINGYFHHFLHTNRFGSSSQNLGSLYKGLARDVRVNFKHLRTRRHTHHPVDDAKGNAEALLPMQRAMGLKITLER